MKNDIYFSDSLKHSNQCLKVTNSANKIVGMVKRTIQCRTKKVMLVLYKSLVRPHLDYCMQVWRPFLKKDVECLEKIQKRFTKSITECKGLRYAERLKVLGLTTFETRCLRGDLLTCFKTLKGFEYLNISEFFSFNERSTRGHMQKLFKQFCRLDATKYSFAYRVIDDWNALPNSVVESESINEFKGGLDRHLRVNAGI